MPDNTDSPPTAAATALLEIDSLSVTFGQGDSAVRAVRGVSLKMERGESIALVGESGSGKSDRKSVV